MPYLTGHWRISGKSTSVPSSLVDQFWLPAMTCARRLTPGAMYCTSGTSFLIASTSSGFRLAAAPDPPRTPPIVKLPAEMVTMFVPPALICASICACAPVPSATSVITAETPMIMPSIVSAVRILLRASAFRAIRVVMTGDMVILDFKICERQLCNNRQRCQFCVGIPPVGYRDVVDNAAVPEGDDTRRILGDVVLVRD